MKRGRKVAKIRFIYQKQDLTEEQPAFFDDPSNVPQLPNQSEDENWEQVYGSERLATLAEGCHYEFDKAQMEQIQMILTRISVPNDHTLSGVNAIIYGRQRYLREKYAELNAVASKKAKKSDKPIKDRFKYFLRMLEEDTFEPAAYKED